MPFPDSVDDKLIVDGLNLRSTQDYTLEAVNGKKIDLKGDVRINGVNVITADELDEVNIVLQYGADPTGVVDAVSAINAAIADVVAAGGGTVKIPSGNFKITSAVTVPDSVSLQGVGSIWVPTGSVHMSRIQCTTSAAKIIVDGGGGLFGNFVIDGTDTAVGPLLHVRGGAERIFQTMLIEKSLGEGIRVDEHQNALFQNVQSHKHLSACLILDKGAGGLSFRDCEFAGAGPAAWHVIITETTGTGPYGTLGPGDNLFDHCLLEYGIWPPGSGTYQGGLDIRAGVGTQLRKCIISSSGWGTSVALVRINDTTLATSAQLVLDDCWLFGNGTDTGVWQILGDLRLVSQLNFQTMANAWRIDIGANMETPGKIIYNSVTNRVHASSTSNITAARANHSRPIFMQELESNDVFAFLVSRRGDSNTRFFLDPDGTIQWGSGSAASDVYLYRGGANLLALVAGDEFRTQYLGIGTFDPGPGKIIFWLENSSDPATAGANTAQLFTKDDGGGRTQLAVVFGTGQTKVLATEDIDKVITTYSGAAVTAAMVDRNAYLRFTNAAPVFTIPLNATVAFPVGTTIEGVGTAAAMTIAATGGVTINKARTLVTVGADSGWSIIKVGTNEWDLHGDFV